MTDQNPFSLPQQPADATDYADDQDAYWDEEETTGAVFWSVEGWSPERPFSGELVFTDEDGEVLVSLPLEPETMQSLYNISSTVIDAQYAHMGVQREGGARESVEDGGKQDSPSDRRTVVEKDIAGVPFRVSVNPKSLALLGVLTGFVLVILLIGVFRG